MRQKAAFGDGVTRDEFKEAMLDVIRAAEELKHAAQEIELAGDDFLRLLDQPSEVFFDTEYISDLDHAEVTGLINEIDAVLGNIGYSVQKVADQWMPVQSMLSDAGFMY